MSADTAEVSSLENQPDSGTNITRITDSFRWTDTVGALILGMISLILLVLYVRCQNELRERG